MDADAIVVGAGVAGLVATAEAADAGRRAIPVGEEPAPSLRGQEGRLREAAARGLVELRFRHQVDELVISGGAVTGVRGSVREPSQVVRGAPSSRAVVGDFSLDAQAVFVTSGGIGANHELVRRNW